MARITAAYTSNFDESKELTALATKGLPVHWPPLVHATGERGGEAPAEPSGEAPETSPVEVWGEGPVSVADQLAAGVAKEDTVTIADQKAGATPPFPPKESEQSSAGTSFSTSGSRPGRSGSSAPETGSSLPSPAPSAENLSEQDQASRQAQSSTAPSTSGSTQETGPSQPDPSNSSAGQQTAQASGTAAIQPLSGRELIQAARREYEAHNWEIARQLLEDAREADPSMSEEVGVALQAVQTASEQTPSAGGFLVQP